MSKVTLKVTHHNRNTNPGQQTDDILLNAKDIPPGLKEHGIVEVNRVGDDFKLLLQIRSLNNEMPNKGTVSLESSVATYFLFRNFTSVEIAPIGSHHVTLELVELGFRDQYFSRSDYFRFANSMRNTVVYTNKKIEFLGVLKCQVSDIWMRGERVSSGFVGADTKIVFRSSTAVVHIFLQISEELWNFDYFGDVYFEKAVSGFLTELCDKWVDNNCSHDVTIVLFSRLFYEANALEDFPPQARHCLLKDHRGRFYEDYFNVIIQNERYTEEWTSVLSRLRLSFNEYKASVLQKHQRHFPGMPKARLCTAAEGNFLETLNMVLNLYQAYNIDRNFDRTGKICVIITPGAGVFEVDRALFNVTKQRVLDLGVGADLVCLGTQPLHAVPLFIFTNDAKSSVTNDYNIPHWINHSFYRSKSELAFRKKYNFIPRISLQFEETQSEEAAQKRRKSQAASRPHEVIDFKEHDAHVFARVSQQPPRRGHAGGFTRRPHRHTHRDRHASDSIPGGGRMMFQLSGETISEAGDPLLGNERRNSEDCTEPNSSGSAEADVGEAGSCDEESGPNSRLCFTESAEGALDRPVVGSAELHSATTSMTRPLVPRKALLNPFAPNRLNIKMTANRRRWAHVFPTDKSGSIVQLHHQKDNTLECILNQQSKRVNLANLCNSNSSLTRKKTLSVDSDSTFTRNLSVLEAGDQDSRLDDSRLLPSVTSVQSIPGSISDKPNSRGAEALCSGSVSGTTDLGMKPPPGSSATSGGISGPLTSAGTKKLLSHKAINSIFKEGDQKWLWGPLGEQEASPITNMARNKTPDCVSLLIETIIGVDWKSLITPACMPVTTDYFPSTQSLLSDFLERNYTLDPGAINADSIRSYEMASEQQKAHCRKPLTPREVFEELVHQRLGWGYQLIVSNNNSLNTLNAATKGSGSLKRSTGLRPASDAPPEMYQLSQGRLFHTLSLNGDFINVLIYAPRSSYETGLGRDATSKGIKYRYRLMVPDAEEFAISTTMFSIEKLEQFTWNLLDNYICTRGEGESYASMDTLKFWRSRFFLLPFNNPATKKLLDNMSSDPNLRFDIYEPRSPSENRQLTEGMMKFADIVNKFRRVDATGQPPSQARKTAKFSFEPADTNRFKDSAENSPVKASGNPGGSSTPEGEEELSYKTSYPKLLSVMMNELLFISHVKNAFPPHTFVAADAVFWLMNNVADIENDINHAISIMKDMLRQRYIMHASCNLEHPFIHGFYFYCILPQSDGSRRDSDSSLRGVSAATFDPNYCFQRDWTEVAFPLRRSTAADRHPGFLANEVPSERLDSFMDTEQAMKFCEGTAFSYFSGADRKVLLMDVEGANREKSPRPEWVMWQYAANYDPTCAFDLELRWLIATGGRLNETISIWRKKVSQLCGLQLLPVPCNQFALPSSQECDPLRCPIFIYLELDHIRASINGRELFDDYPAKTRKKRLCLFQESILLRFGFLPDGVYKQEADDEARTFVHSTGGMFAMIPDYSNVENRTMFGPRTPVVKNTRVRLASTQDFSRRSSQVIDRRRVPDVTEQPHVMRRNSTARPDEEKVVTSADDMPSDPVKFDIEPSDDEEVTDPVEAGFIWAWNYMLTKRWRSQSTGDEMFQDKILADFRAFCSNKDNRLVDYWHHCHAQFVAYSLPAAGEVIPDA